MEPIKIVREPKVYLLGRQTVDDAELKRFLADHEFADWATDSPADCETLVEVAARTCYQSFKGGRPHDDHVRHLLEVGHGSCIEHAVFSLLVTGVSRALTHELVRHRAGISPSQLSQRYVDESVAEYVEPDIIANDRELHDEWVLAVRDAHRAYVRLASMLDRLLSPGHRLATELPPNATGTDRRKAARQAARSVLPNATETKIFLTANARALRHFVELRASVHADPEIRKLANRVLEAVRPAAPNLFGDYVTAAFLSDGTYTVETEFRKV